MLHSDQVQELSAVSASVMAALMLEERVEPTVDSDSAGSGEAVVILEYLELAVMYFGFAVESVEEWGQLEVLVRPGWTA